MAESTMRNLLFTCFFILISCVFFICQCCEWQWAIVMQQEINVHSALYFMLLYSCTVLLSSQLSYFLHCEPLKLLITKHNDYCSSLRPFSSIVISLKGYNTVRCLLCFPIHNCLHLVLIEYKRCFSVSRDRRDSINVKSRANGQLLF